MIAIGMIAKTIIVIFILCWLFFACVYCCKNCIKYYHDKNILNVFGHSFLFMWITIIITSFVGVLKLIWS